MRLVQEITEDFEVEVSGLTLYVPVQAVCVMAHETFAYHGLAGDIAHGHQQSVEIEHLDINWNLYLINDDEENVYIKWLPLAMRKKIKEMIPPLVIEQAELDSRWSEEED